MDDNRISEWQKLERATFHEQQRREHEWHEQLLQQVEERGGAIPRDVLRHLLRRGGCELRDERHLLLVSLAAECLLQRATLLALKQRQLSQKQHQKQDRMEDERMNEFGNDEDEEELDDEEDEERVAEVLAQREQRERRRREREAVLTRGDVAVALAQLGVASQPPDTAAD
ncbi:MAG: hypothetical protein MHM6MM_005671 [Cercozoa sp. M6MM]